MKSKGEILEEINEQHKDGHKSPLYPLIVQNEGLTTVLFEAMDKYAVQMAAELLAGINVLPKDFEDWANGEEGENCSNYSNLTGKEYLINRLHRAYMEGANKARSKFIKTLTS